jgi:putative hydrolase of the HAD superfamily
MEMSVENFEDSSFSVIKDRSCLVKNIGWEASSDTFIHIFYDFIDRIVNPKSKIQNPKSKMQDRSPTLLDISFSLPLPQVIFLDAVGTLFGVRGSVGGIYSEVAARYGVDCEPEVLNRHFYTAFKQAHPCVFPDVSIADIPEYQWWREINRQTFMAAGVWAQFDDFDTFFRELYGYFATAAAWEIYPDVIPALTRWQQTGVKLGVLSNFDSRLYTVLEVLKLDRYFSTVTISTEVGAAKPHSKIFTAALGKYSRSSDSAWHIGDSWDEDYLGASNAGLRAIWLDRDEN